MKSPAPLIAGTRCLACAYRCDLASETARCRVRSLEDGRLVVRGGEILESLDPIESKPIFHFAPGTTVLALGSFGCSMRCPYCRNADFALAAHRSSSADDPEVILERAVAAGAAGVCFGFNEPLVRAERVAAVFETARNAGLYTALVTHGAATDASLSLLGPLTDVWRIDLKGGRRASYERLGGNGLPWGSVYRTAAAARVVHDAHIELVTTVVPGLNDGEPELRRMARWITKRLGADTAWHLQRFLPAYRMSHVEETPTQTLIAARQIAIESGLPHVYLHNAAVRSARDTVCRECGATLIERHVESVAMHLDAAGHCAGCGSPTPVALPESDRGRRPVMPETRQTVSRP